MEVIFTLRFSHFIHIFLFHQKPHVFLKLFPFANKKKTIAVVNCPVTICNTHKFHAYYNTNINMDIVKEILEKEQRDLEKFKSIKVDKHLEVRSDLGMLMCSDPNDFDDNQLK